MKKKNKAFNDWFMLAFVAVGCGLWSYSHMKGTVADSMPSTTGKQTNSAGQEQSTDDSSAGEDNSSKPAQQPTSPTN